MEETLGGLDTLQGRSLRISEIVGDTHHIDGKLHETADVLIHHVARPRAPDSSQTSTMRHTEESTQFVFQFVAGEILLCAALCQVIVRE